MLPPSSLPPGGQLHEPQVRRHRPGPSHLQEPVPAHGGRHWAGKPGEGCCHMPLSTTPSNTVLDLSTRGWLVSGREHCRADRCAASCRTGRHSGLPERSLRRMPVQLRCPMGKAACHAGCRVGASLTTSHCCWAGGISLVQCFVRIAMLCSPSLTPPLPPLAYPIASPLSADAVL